MSISITTTYTTADKPGTIGQTVYHTTYPTAEEAELLIDALDANYTGLADEMGEERLYDPQQTWKDVRGTLSEDNPDILEPFDQYIPAPPEGFENARIMIDFLL